MNNFYRAFMIAFIGIIWHFPSATGKWIHKVIVAVEQEQKKAGTFHE